MSRSLRITSETKAIINIPAFMDLAGDIPENISENPASIPGFYTL